MDALTPAQFENVFNRREFNPPAADAFDFGEEFDAALDIVEAFLRGKVKPPNYHVHQGFQTKLPKPNHAFHSIAGPVA